MDQQPKNHDTGNVDSDVDVSTLTLVEQKELSYSVDNAMPGDAGSENVIVHGDNLPVLALLDESLASNVRCIYIDPPYNTGSTFAQYDDGIDHSRWLDFMALRLRRLFRLLSDDGSIWISVDDNEGHYLKVLCDELFGRANFVTTVVWQKKYTQANDTGFFSDNHDFILVYARDRTKLRFNSLPRSDKQNRAYRNPDDDPRGPWKSTPLHAKSGSDHEFEFTFSNGTVWRPPVGTFPRFSAKNLRRMDENREIWFGKKGTAVPSRKTFLTDVRQGVAPKSIWLHEEVGQNHEARSEARAIVPQAPFSTPKPERLLQRIIGLASDAGDLVLDGFAGSGTTGAVAHKMGRRWVMIESGTHCRSHIHPRMEMVVQGRDPGGVTAAEDWEGGGGFRFLTLSPIL